MKRVVVITLLLGFYGAACGRVGDSSEADSGGTTDTTSDTSTGAESGADTGGGVDAQPAGCPAEIPAASPPMECDKSLVGTECTYHCDLHGSLKYKCLTSGDFPYPIWYQTQGCFDPSADSH
jgi:hypothetical protein